MTNFANRSTTILKLALVCFLGLIFTGCASDDKRILLLLTNSDLAESADIADLDYYPEESSFFAFAEFSAPANYRDQWLFNDYKIAPCDIFTSLAATGNLKKSWETLIPGGTCFENKILLRNPLASYNEISILLNGEKILLYAAGIDDPAYIIQE